MAKTPCPPLLSVPSNFFRSPQHLQCSGDSYNSCNLSLLLLGGRFLTTCCPPFRKLQRCQALLILPRVSPGPPHSSEAVAAVHKSTELDGRSMQLLFQKLSTQIHSQHIPEIKSQLLTQKYLEFALTCESPHYNTADSV